LWSLVKLARTLGLVVWELEMEGVKSQPYRDARRDAGDVARRLAEGG
jgi:hypothetical protein